MAVDFPGSPGTKSLVTPILTPAEVLVLAMFTVVSTRAPASARLLPAKVLKVGGFSNGSVVTGRVGLGVAAGVVVCAIVIICRSIGKTIDACGSIGIK